MYRKLLLLAPIVSKKIIDYNIKSLQGFGQFYFSMKIFNQSIWSALIISCLATSCTEEYEVTPDLNEYRKLELDFSSLPELGYNFVYEGWITVNDSAISTGIFKGNENGNATRKSFLLNIDDLTNATNFIVTIEPFPDNNPFPSATHIMGGNFNEDVADLTIGHSSGFNTDFLSADGSFILATPTNEDETSSDEKSGIWWLDPTGPSASLELPELTTGWNYEGWVVIDGTPVSTGTFTQVDQMDENNKYGGILPSPEFPGEDFLFHAPDGLNFPVDLSGSTAVISIEPNPDNDPAPFDLKPLVGSIPVDANEHTSYPMENNISNSTPTGVASR